MLLASHIFFTKSKENICFLAQPCALSLGAAMIASSAGVLLLSLPSYFLFKTFKYYHVL